MQVTRSLGSLLAVWLLLINGVACAAITSDSVLVLYNQSSPEGIAIAEYYSQVHPGVHLLGLTGVTTADDITADYYLSTIRPQVLSALTDSIDVIVTTKGLPLRINAAPHTNPGVYTDPFGIQRSVYSTTWKTYSSLESELTRIDAISTWQQMGDQTYWTSTAPWHQAKNPYYASNQSTASFSHAAYGTRLTSRLDGFTVSDVTASIDRAQQAHLTIGLPQTVVVDDDPTCSGDRMQLLKDNVLTPMGQDYLYDNTTAAITAANNPVIGYVSHGVHGGGLTTGYIANQLQFRLDEGAVFSTYESYNAYSFSEGGSRGGQGLIGDWLRIGGTAGVGHVEEPSTGASNVANEDMMFKMLLSGYTWGEAAWRSMQQLSYVNTVVGDPLMTFREVLPGDADLDGVVDLDDFDLWKYSYANQLSPTWRNGDFDGNGGIDTDDFDLWKRSYFNQTVTLVPEPASLWLLTAVFLGLTPLPRRRRRGVRAAY